MRDEHLAVIQAPSSEVIMVEHFARFINLQRYVLKEGNVGGEKSYSLKKLHPVAAMTRDMLREQQDLVSALSMTPVDLMNLWRKMEKYFPDRVSPKDSPDKFFFPEKPSNKKRRITLEQTKVYETRLKGLLVEFAEADPDKYEELRSSFEPPPLRKIDSLDIANELYGVVDEMKVRVKRTNTSVRNAVLLTPFFARRFRCRRETTSSLQSPSSCPPSARSRCSRPSFAASSSRRTRGTPTTAPTSGSARRRR